MEGGRFGQEVEAYLADAVEMYRSAPDADIIFLVLPEKLSAPGPLREIQRTLADHMTINEKPNPLLVVLPHGIALYGVARVDPLPRVEP